MIKTIRHKGLKRFFETGSTAAVHQGHTSRLRLILAKLNAAVDVHDMGFPGSNLHPLKGKRKGYWSVQISGSWRLIFRFKDGDAYDVDYLDYH